MVEFNFIEYLRTEKRLNDYQIGKIQKLLDSFVKDDLSSSVQSAGSSTLMSSGAVLPEAGNSFTDARNVADAFHMIMVL